MLTFGFGNLHGTAKLSNLAWAQMARAALVGDLANTHRRIALDQAPATRMSEKPAPRRHGSGCGPRPASSLTATPLSLASSCGSTACNVRLHSLDVGNCQATYFTSADERLDVHFDPALVHRQRRFLYRPTAAAKYATGPRLIQIPIANFGNRDRASQAGTLGRWVSAFRGLRELPTANCPRLLWCQRAGAPYDHPPRSAFGISILDEIRLRSAGLEADAKALQFRVPYEHVLTWLRTHTLDHAFGDFPHCGQSVRQNLLPRADSTLRGCPTRRHR